MCLMSQNSSSEHKSFDFVLLTVIAFRAIVEKRMFSSFAEIFLDKALDKLKTPSHFSSSFTVELLFRCRYVAC